MASSGNEANSERHCKRIETPEQVIFVLYLLHANSRLVAEVK